MQTTSAAGITNLFSDHYPLPIVLSQCKHLPDQSFQNIIHYKVALNDDQQQCHMCVTELGHLKSILSFLEISNEEHKAYKEG